MVDLIFDKGVEDKHADMVVTLVKPGADILARLTPEMVDLWHQATGFATEASEFLDAVKKHVIYGKPLDLENCTEELGDAEFYAQAIRNNIKVTRIQSLEHNLNKLAERYRGYKYTDEQAIARADKSGT